MSRWITSFWLTLLLIGTAGPSRSSAQGCIGSFDFCAGGKRIRSLPGAWPRMIGLLEFYGRLTKISGKSGGKGPRIGE
jgi:hypothetical protein